MVIYSMNVSADGFIADRDGGINWSVPDEEQYRRHIDETRQLGVMLLGRRLYETMLVWDTDLSLRDSEPGASFAEAWCAVPKVVFSRTLDKVQGNARLATASLEDEIAAALDVTSRNDGIRKYVGIGGATLAAAAFERGLVDELSMFRHPIVVGGGTPFLPPVTKDIRLNLIETRAFGSGVIHERYRRA